MNWFGGVMNGNNTAMEFQIEFSSAFGTVQQLTKGSGSGATGDHIYIDWGDGSAIQRFSDIASGAGHTYGGTGPYRIRSWQQDFDINNPDNDWAFDNFYKYSNTDETLWRGIATTLSAASQIISFGLIMYNAKGDGNGLQFGERRFVPGWDMAHVQNYPIISSTSEKNLQRFFQSSKGYTAIWKDPYGNNKKLYWFDHPDYSPGVFSLSFFGQTDFNCYVGGWNMSNTTNLASIFRSTAFNNDGVDDLNNWDTSNVGSFSQTFRSCTTFNLDLSSWSFASAISLQRMLESASSFNQDISAWGTNDGGMSTGAGPFSNMLDNTAMSVENYSKWLICLANWAFDNNLTGSELLGANGCEYDNTTYNGIGSGEYTDAVSARNYLDATLNWTISGDSQV